MRYLILVFVLMFTQVVSAEEITKQQAINESVAKIKQSLRPTGVAARTAPEVPDNSPLEMFKGLCICLGVFLIGVAAAKQLQKNKEKNNLNSSLHILEKITVTPKTALVLAECDGRRFVFSVGSENVAFYPQEDSKHQLSFADVYQIEDKKGEERAA